MYQVFFVDPKVPSDMYKMMGKFNRFDNINDALLFVQNNFNLSNYRVLENKYYIFKNSLIDVWIEQY
jgi:hypothetical protein